MREGVLRHPSTTKLEWFENQQSPEVIENIGNKYKPNVISLQRRGDVMSVIKTIQSEDCTICIHNDRMVKTEKEREEIIGRVSGIILRYYQNQGEQRGAAQIL